MRKLKQILVNLLILAIFLTGIVIYLWNRTYPEIAQCFDNAPDLQEILSVPLAEQSNSDLLGLPRITPDNIQELANLHSFGTFDGRVTALGVSPDDTVIASVSINGPINIFHFTNHQIITITENTGIIDSLAVSPSNSILASYNSRGNVMLWDTRDGNQIALWNAGGSSAYNRLAFISPQELVYSTGQSVYLCNLALKENRKLFDSMGVADFENGNTLTKGGVASFAEIILTDDQSSLIYSTSGDNDSTGIPEVGVWNFASETKTQSFTLHDTEITDISLSSNGQRLASISRDGVINMVDLASDNNLSSMQNNGSPSDYAIALNWDGSLLFVADQTTGTLSTWNVDTLSLMSIESFPGINVVDVIFNTTGNLIISSGTGQGVIIWGITAE